MPSVAALTAGYRKALEQRARLAAMAFPAQRKAIDDAARLKAWLCTRRAGKSTGVGIDIFETHNRYPGASSLYVGLTRDTCKRIMWKDVLIRMNDELGLGVKFGLAELSVQSPNKSTTYFIGADSSPKEMRKALGQKLCKVWIDEAQEFTIDLRKFVYEVLKLATADHRGQIVLSGTPGDYVGPKLKPDGVTPGRHLFFAITKALNLEPGLAMPFPEEPLEGGWSTSAWDTSDNPHMAAQFSEEKAEIERDRAWYLESPEYARMYRGRWAIDTNRLVYRYADAVNAIHALVAAPANVESYVIAADLGFNDATAFVVAGWRPHDPNLYILRAWKQTGMSLTHVADAFRVLRDQYPGAKLVVDGAAKQSVEEMRQREKLPLVATAKTDKFDFIRMMNAAMQDGKIRVVTATSQPLLDEWGGLVWDDRALTLVPREKDSCDNHLADAALYAWRFARNFIWSPAKGPKKTAAEQAHEDMLREAEQMSGEINGTEVWSE